MATPVDLVMLSAGEGTRLKSKLPEYCTDRADCKKMQPGIGLFAGSQANFRFRDRNIRQGMTFFLRRSAFLSV